MLPFFKKQLKIGIIGCGAIGTVLAKEISNISGAKVICLCDVDEGRAKALAEQLGDKVKVVDVNKLILMSDLVIEAASRGIVKEVVSRCISKKRDVMCMSVGGFIGNEGLLDRAEEKACKIYLPSGAIAGLDAVKAAAFGNIKSVTLTTTKPPEGLDGASYVVKNKIDLFKLKSSKVIFEGTVTQAVKSFPRNINVSAALSLVGIGAKKTKVKIIVDPNAKRNVHEITVDGDIGKITTKTENMPSPLNPRTSYLAVLSAIAMVKRIVSNVEVGT